MAFLRPTILSEEFKDLLLRGIDQNCFPFRGALNLPPVGGRTFRAEMMTGRSLAEMRRALTTGTIRDQECHTYGIEAMDWEYQIRIVTAWTLLLYYGEYQ